MNNTRRGFFFFDLPRVSFEGGRERNGRGEREEEMEVITHDSVDPVDPHEWSKEF